MPSAWRCPCPARQSRVDGLAVNDAVPAGPLRRLMSTVCQPPLVVSPASSPAPDADRARVRSVPLTAPPPRVALLRAAPRAAPSLGAQDTSRLTSFHAAYSPELGCLAVFEKERCACPCPHTHDPTTRCARSSSCAPGLGTRAHARGTARWRCPGPFCVVVVCDMFACDSDSMLRVPQVMRRRPMKTHEFGVHGFFMGWPFHETFPKPTRNRSG